TWRGFRVRGMGGRWRAWACDRRMVVGWRGWACDRRRVVRWRAWTCDCRGLDDSARNTRSTGTAIREGTFLPIDIGVDPFAPRHSQNHLIGTERGNEEDFLVFDTTEGELEGNDTVCMD